METTKEHIKCSREKLHDHYKYMHVYVQKADDPQRRDKQCAPAIDKSYLDGAICHLILPICIVR